MKKENILKHLTILQNIILIIFPYILSKRGNHSRKTVILFLIFLTIIFLVVNGRKIIIDKRGNVLNAEDNNNNIYCPMGYGRICKSECAWFSMRSETLCICKNDIVIGQK